MQQEQPYQTKQDSTQFEQEQPLQQASSSVSQNVNFYKSRSDNKYASLNNYFNCLNNDQVDCK